MFTVNEGLLDAITSVNQMRLLYNNYELDTLVNEYVTPLEKKEENDFVDGLMTSPLIRHAMTFLKDKGSNAKLCCEPVLFINS